MEGVRKGREGKGFEGRGGKGERRGEEEIVEMEEERRGRRGEGWRSK